MLNYQNMMLGTVYDISLTSKWRHDIAIDLKASMYINLVFDPF